jgi:hypothetical protein
MLIYMISFIIQVFMQSDILPYGRLLSTLLTIALKRDFRPCLKAANCLITFECSLGFLQDCDTTAVLRAKVSFSSTDEKEQKQAKRKAGEPNYLIAAVMPQSLVFHESDFHFSG